MKACILDVIWRYLEDHWNEYERGVVSGMGNEKAGRTFSSPLISTLMCSLMAPDTADLSVLFSKLYHTSISPDNVRTYWEKKN